ncbi:MAG: GNAT family N-acetyltransferase [Bacteroidota bacterium]|nr:GNAT family N-acetyltransferase [Bacteroidota bacterium]
MQTITVQKDDFIITTDKSKLDTSVIHDFLSNHSYWSRNIPLEKVKTAFDNSLNFGLFHNSRQIGYARVISDFSQIAYLADVFIVEEYRGRGLSKWLMQTIMSHPNLQGLRKWVLVTKDAHELYKKFGWQPISSPEKWMEKVNPDFGNDSVKSIDFSSKDIL